MWAQANFQCFLLKHRWTYDIDGRLGKFLSAQGACFDNGALLGDEGTMGEQGGGSG